VAARLAAPLLALLALPLPAAALDPVNQTRFGGKAIEGYDPVAYFEQGEPVKGSKQWSAEWNGATWLFASAAHRDLFAADPEAYAPRYGGYCAWAVSQGYTAGIDPEAWTIRDGRLYLNYSPEIQERWLAEVEEAIDRADANWPTLLGGD
jgi:YHS domain-containing protein